MFQHAFILSIGLWLKGGREDGLKRPYFRLWN